MSRLQCGCIYADAKNTPAVRNGFEAGGYLKRGCAQHANAAHVYHAPLGFSEHEKSAWSIGYEEGRNAAITEAEETASELHEADKRIAHLKSIVDEVHSWAVFAAITDAQDMAQNFPRIVEITAL